MNQLYVYMSIYGSIYAPIYKYLYVYTHIRTLIHLGKRRRSRLLWEVQSYLKD